jgi:hypothetical protein
MWARLDDALIDHQKVFIAGEAIGKNGPAVAIGFYAIALMWSNKQLSDGFLPDSVIRSFTRYADNPRSVADALVKAELFDKVDGGFRIHDYADYNPSAANIKKKRREDRLRKAEARQ